MSSIWRTTVRRVSFLGDSEPYDVVILDLGLPKLDGLSVLRQWRQAGREMPVLILTARDTWREKVTGLRAGADDYLAKPFELEEMLARVEALIRRSSGRASPVLECGPLTLDVSTTRLTVAGRPVELTALEFRTLAHLMRHQDRVVSKTELTEHLYDQDVRPRLQRDRGSGQSPAQQAGSRAYQNPQRAGIPADNAGR